MKSARIGLRAAALVTLAAAAIGIGMGFVIHSANTGAGATRTTNPPGLHGQATWRPGERAAPDFRLADQTGQPVSLTSLRGRSVMLVFFGSRCQGACAREARALSVALRLLPPLARPVLVVVSLDPAHDTPESARAAAARLGLESAVDWHWLLGSRAQLAPVWSAYRVAGRAGGRADATAYPAYLIDHDGFQRAGLLYPFPPGWPAGDLRILSQQG
jgi:protein SCO1